MNLLLLNPHARHLHLTLFNTDQPHPIWQTQITDYRRFDREPLTQSFRHGPAPSTFASPDAFAVRVPFGGPEFTGPALLTDAVFQKLQHQIPHASLHLPALLELLNRCRRTFPNLPVVLLFETAFFTQLPAREYRYGLNPNLADSLGARRYGYHGLFHQGACAHVRRTRRHLDNNYTPLENNPLRILSICLQPQSELAAVRVGQPLMVTSGATPLEGLPGHTSAGHLDPSIVLTLAQKLNWGPEQINTLLTQQSGLLALTGRPITLPELYANQNSPSGSLSGPADSPAAPSGSSLNPADSPAGSSDSPPGPAELDLARRIFEYRLLNACGAGIAAMGGLDAVVFSGAYVRVGQLLASKLLLLLETACRHAQPQPYNIVACCFTDPLEKIMLEQAQHLLLCLPARQTG